MATNGNPQYIVSGTAEGNIVELLPEVQPTQYVNASARDTLNWLRAGLCAFCGGKCSSGGCRLRYCDSCSQWWIAGTEQDWDFGHPEAKETCPPCGLLEVILVRREGKRTEAVA